MTKRHATRNTSQLGLWALSSRSRLLKRCGCDKPQMITRRAGAFSVLFFVVVLGSALSQPGLGPCFNQKQGTIACLVPNVLGPGYAQAGAQQPNAPTGNAVIV